MWQIDCLFNFLNKKYPGAPLLASSGAPGRCPRLRVVADDRHVVDEVAFPGHPGDGQSELPSDVVVVQVVGLVGIVEHPAIAGANPGSTVFEVDDSPVALQIVDKAAKIPCLLMAEAAVQVELQIGIGVGEGKPAEDLLLAGRVGQGANAVAQAGGEGLLEVTAVAETEGFLAISNEVDVELVVARVGDVQQFVGHRGGLAGLAGLGHGSEADEDHEADEGDENELLHETFPPGKCYRVTRGRLKANIVLYHKISKLSMQIGLQLLTKWLYYCKISLVKLCRGGGIGRHASLRS